MGSTEGDSSSTTYWTISHGIANRSGYTCRECKRSIPVNAPIICRDGRKIRLFYHQHCFSQHPDPRSQQNSSSKSAKWDGGISSSAPRGKGCGKWWTSEYGYRGAPSKLGITRSQSLHLDQKKNKSQKQIKEQDPEADLRSSGVVPDGECD